MGYLGRIDWIHGGKSSMLQSQRNRWKGWAMLSCTCDRLTAHGLAVKRLNKDHNLVAVQGVLARDHRQCWEGLSPCRLFLTEHGRGRSWTSLLQAETDYNTPTRLFELPLCCKSCW
ncbi:uncharacterized protein BO96DRAFT_437194 [Aspergillus niger CBS 101883]|uniref:Uncharacterized protein n=2 Tax=Aspergillus niger TaxID=5061 RepID=A2R0S0_ASPNC|nr:uncharacterized protein BO96DRAFT_437194 [Aspergillus niger CBS 101883]XP_059606971.1 hypothetical protein An12g09565 [Aspergillus niger]PYH53229.1 hypothetical protein BO96DRAFT_437194 [Aspergillus niger CBS 101883]CAL00862.1 hypothetical protein An12g09565 [Aspergillus niger]